MAEISISGLKKDVQDTILANQAKFNPNYNAYIDKEEIGTLLSHYGTDDISELQNDAENSLKKDKTADNTEDDFQAQPDDDEETKKAKKKKIIKGIAIGATVAVAAGLIIYDLKRPNGLIKRLFKKTGLGKEIKSGIDFAKEAHEIPMEKLVSEDTGILDKIVNRAKESGTNIAGKVVSDTSFSGEVGQYIEGRISGNPQIVSELQNACSPAEAYQKTIELSGTGTTKMAQIVSNNPSVMTKIESISPEMAEAIRNTRTNCSFSRTFEEASEFLEESFAGKGYVLQSELGAGTIGATYLAKAPDGSDVVIKMIKNGVSREALTTEMNMVDDFIVKISDSAEEISELHKMNRGLYADWMNELDLFQSMKNSEDLAKGAKRFSVARVLEVSENGQCLVMEKAKGIRMNNLVEILNDYKMNPAEFHTKYAELIEQNPWLGNPEKVMSEISDSLLKSFDEQFLFLKKGKKTIMHGDPHTGNFFITTDKKGRLIPEFIDTDNVVRRTSAQIKQDLTFFSNYFVGNSEKIAEYFVNQCECNPNEKAKLISAVASDIKEFIFAKKCNIKDMSAVRDNIQVILKNHGLKMTTDNATALKAQMQYLCNVSEAAHISGGHTNIMTIMKDIPRASLNMLRAGTRPLTCVKSALAYAFRNIGDAVGNAYQFMIKDANVIN